MTPTLGMIGFCMTPAISAECQRVAAELRLAYSRVSNLNAACAALARHPQVIVLASDRLRPWDRDIIMEHATRAAAHLVWVTPDERPDDIAEVARTWARKALRPKHR